MKVFKLILVVTLLFGLGVTTGVLGSKYLVHKKMAWLAKGKPGDRVEFLVKRLDRKLVLSGEQKKKVRKIFQVGFAEMEMLREEFHPEMHAFLQNQIEQVREILDAEQQQKLDTLLRDRLPLSPFVPPPPGGKHGPKPPATAQDLLQRLDPALHFTKEQWMQAEPVLADFLTAQKQVMEEGRSLRKTVQMKRRKIENDLEEKLSKILTPEQMQQLKEIQQKHRNRR
jgi:Spy/CpxP family protein refolding chaperone